MWYYRGMIEIYLCESANIHEKLNGVLKGKIGSEFEILKGEKGKPYIDGYPCHFSLSHSEDYGMFAISDNNVGLDFEFFEHGKVKEFPHIVSRLTLNEQMEIGGSTVRFLQNWVCKEAYIKYMGETLASYLSRLEYYGGYMYLDGKKQDCKIKHFITFCGIFAVCVANCNQSDIESVSIIDLVEKE